LEQIISILSQIALKIGAQDDITRVPRTPGHRPRFVVRHLPAACPCASSEPIKRPRNGIVSLLIQIEKPTLHPTGTLERNALLTNDFY
jgi:hypothetical protein